MRSGDQIPSAKARLERGYRRFIRLVIVGSGLWLLIFSALIAEQMGLEISLWLGTATGGTFAVFTLVLIGLGRRLTRMQEDHRKGLCIVCRYELGGLETCPECGTPVGGCKRCGYDLAGIEGRCPECGEPVVAGVGG